MCDCKHDDCWVVFEAQWVSFALKFSPENLNVHDASISVSFQQAWSDFNYVTKATMPSEFECFCFFHLLMWFSAESRGAGTRQNDMRESLTLMGFVSLCKINIVLTLTPSCTHICGFQHSTLQAGGRWKSSKHSHVAWGWSLSIQLTFELQVERFALTFQTRERDMLSVVHVGFDWRKQDALQCPCWAGKCVTNKAADMSRSTNLLDFIVSSLS